MGDDLRLWRPVRSMIGSVALCAAPVFVTQGGTQSVARPPSRAHAAATDSSVAKREWIEIRNVSLHLWDEVVIRVHALHGQVLATVPGRPPALDDATSFRIHVTAGTVALTGDDLGALLNHVVFAYPGAPLRDIRVRTDGTQIVQTGIMHKGVDLKFRLRGTLDLLPDGRVRIHPTSVTVLGLNGERVLHMVGLHLESILDLRGAHGASVKGDDLILDPMAILPPPAIDGRLASIRVEGDAVVQEFVTLPEDSAFRRLVSSDTTKHNFILLPGRAAAIRQVAHDGYRPADRGSGL